MAYTKEQEARLQEFDEITYDDAVALGTELGYSTRSIVSKAQHLNIPYVRKEVPAKAEPKETKAEVLEELESALPFDTAGLKGATRDALIALRDFVDEL